MTRWVGIALAAVCLVACEDPPQPEWSTAPLTYRCTAEQQARVDAETKACNDNTSYFGTYCYGAAFIRNCTKPDGGSR